ncbi:MAG TPA: enoyl-CoA hydratase [Candidatus Competibacteraceae bacterium]|nr:enoyl-CoA hydratase [Candidatus Competibacteraceae bacterium]
MSENTQQILTELQDGVLHVILNRPEKKNALTNAMYDALRAALERAEADPAVRVVLFSGSGGSFTAGNDLGDFLNAPPQDEHSPVFRFLLAASRASKPLAAAVAGAAVGIGTTLLLHCELVYCAPGSRFQMPFVNLGLCPEAASSLLLPARLGHARAAELLLLGESFGAEQALAWGLVNAVVDGDQLLTHAVERCQALAAQPPAAVRLTKALLKRAQAQAVAETIALEGRHFAERLQSPEAKEAFQAFFEKRRPDFSRFS